MPQLRKSAPFHPTSQPAVAQSANTTAAEAGTAASRALAAAKRATVYEPIFKKRMVKLPVKLSALIELTIADIKKAERSPRYVVNMDIWHEPRVEQVWSEKRGEFFMPKVETCTVCAAGSVMAGTLKVPLSTDCGPEDFSAWNRARLLACNFFRLGEVAEAAIDLQPRKHFTEVQQALLDSGDLTTDYCSYGDDPEGFKSWSLAVAKKLRKVGL